ncbi:hypothetical protein protein [Bacillus cereus G9241]|nr:hypothetical protein protein [Bacillus cereus G9241]
MEEYLLFFTISYFYDKEHKYTIKNKKELFFLILLINQ